MTNLCKSSLCTGRRNIQPHAGKALAGVLFVCLALSAACRMGAAPLPATPAPGAVPSAAPTSTAIPTPTPVSFLPAASPPPLPPTPKAKVHTVREGDTLLSIAFAADVSVQDLRASNPELDERIISLGQKIVIPPKQDGKVVLPQPTPVDPGFTTPECVRTTDGGAWCISQTQNNSGGALEGCMVRISLLNSAGEILASQDSALPLERLDAGRKAPALAYFPPPLPQAAAVSLQVLVCLPVNPADGRFLAPQVQVGGIQPSQDGLSARVAGSITLPADSPLAGSVSILAAGYDERGRIVGVRKWQGEGQFSGQEVLPFDLTVFSLGAPIVNVDVQAEARPLKSNP